MTDKRIYTAYRLYNTPNRGIILYEDFTDGCLNYSWHFVAQLDTDKIKSFMSKKKHKGGKNRKVKIENLKLQHDSRQSSKIRISPFAYWTRLFTLFTTIIAVSILAFTALLTNWFNETPIAIKWNMAIGGFLITSIRLREILRGHRSNLYLISKKSAVIDFVLVGTLIVICAIPALRGMGIVEKIADWVSLLAPIVGKAVSNIIAWILTFAIPSAVSGVIGNFVYDALKKIYSSKESKNAKE